MRKTSTEGAFTITGPGVDSSSITLGSAISKAITLGSRLRREMRNHGESARLANELGLPLQNWEREEPEHARDVRSLYVRKLGEEAVARIDVSPDVIEVHSFATTR